MFLVSTTLATTSTEPSTTTESTTITQRKETGSTNIVTGCKNPYLAFALHWPGLGSWKKCLFYIFFLLTEPVTTSSTTTKESFTESTTTKGTSLSELW